jgi:hypothetical protein
MTNDRTPAEYLLLRDAVEVVLYVDAEGARDLPDDVVIETLGRAALEQVREHQDEGDP